ncbi:MAG: PilZ domain-containing protein [Acidimicrobiales bacterium]
MEQKWLSVRFGERRIGERYGLHDPVFQWRVPADTAGRRERRKAKPAECRFLDVSVTGALILAPVASDLRVGAHVLIGYEDESTTVRIRRIEPYNKALSIYGVSFVDLGPRLQELIFMTGDRYPQ